MKNLTLDLSEVEEGRRKTFRKKFIYYGLAWLVGTFVCMDLFDAFYFMVTTSGPLTLNVDPRFPLAIIFWVFYWYAALAWRLWLRIRKAPLAFETYKWGLIGTWVLVSLSSVLMFYPVRHETRGVGSGGAAIVLFGFLLSMLHACIGGSVGVQVYERTRNLPKVRDFHRVAIISAIFGVAGIALSKLPGPAAESATWWQLTISWLIMGGVATIIVAVIARTIKSRAEFEYGNSDGNSP